MIFTETKLKGAYVIDLEPHEDHRGFFARTYCVKEFSEHGLSTEISQCNMSYTKSKWTVRGMHFQVHPYEEVKLVRCVKGCVLDTIVDLRRNSPTFGQWVSVELSEENCKAFYVPENFAHGFMSLSDDVIFTYQVSRPYAPGSESGLRWNDPDIGIKWPKTDGVIISDKDKNAPLWRDTFGK